MSRAAITIAYDGPALSGGVMDVRDLAPALLAAGQLVDAANAVLFGENVQVSVQVVATGTGSFEIGLQVVENIGRQIVALFSGPEATAAGTLATLIFGTPALHGVVWLIKRLRGQKPDRVEKISDSTVRLTIGSETIEIPLMLLRLYQDLPVRVAAEKLVEQPLQSDGINSFEVRDRKQTIVEVSKRESAYFRRPEMPDELLIDDVRRSAYSIISLAFKEDNKWRLNDEQNAISATIEDEKFLDKVDRNQIAFAKGDILVCDVRVTQRRTESGLKTELHCDQRSRSSPCLSAIAAGAGRRHRNTSARPCNRSRVNRSTCRATRKQVMDDALQTGPGGPSERLGGTCRPPQTPRLQCMARQSIHSIDFH
jgi:hypothetical protein